MKVLMVCLGNICRSPLAQAILEQKAKEHGIELEVDSAGTANYHVGEKADIRSIEKAQEYGIDINHYRGRQINTSDFDEFDLIFAMDTSNYNNILALTNDREKQQRVKLILNESHPGSNQSVPDPYYGGEEGFENVYQMLDEACDVLIEKIKVGEA